MKKIPLFIIFFILFSLFFGCKSRKNRGFSFDEGMVWNTEFHITYSGPETLKDSIRKVLEEVGRNLSVFDSTSLVSKVNKEDSVKVNRDFIRVYEMAKKINEASEGIFDPTLSPLITAWGFGPGHKATSDTLRIDSLLQITGISKTSLSGNILIKEKPGIQFNFSAIAKGYGCDRVAEMLERNGVENYLVEIGGEIAARGKNPRGLNWSISIDRPIFSNDSIIHEAQEIVCFTDMGMATSGNYRNYHGTGSSRYGHTISPITGRPATTDILSATVLAPSAMEADGWATALMAMGSKKGIEKASQLSIPVMLICSDTIWMSPSFKKLIAK